MSFIDAGNLVSRLKDDEAFRKTIRAMDFAQARRLVEAEDYTCSREEIQKD